MRTQTLTLALLWTILLGMVVLPTRAGSQETPVDPPGQPPVKPAPTGAMHVKPPVVKPQAVKPVPIDRSRLFLAAHRTTLWRGRFEYRNIGANIPDLFERFLNGQDTGATAALDDAHKAGIRFVRCAGITAGADQFRLFETDRARWMAAFDRMLTAADDRGIAVVPSLLFDIRLLPDVFQRKSGKDEGLVGLMTAGSETNALAVAYVTAMVGHAKNDPRVLCWEIGNEYNLEADLSTQGKPRDSKQIITSDQVRTFLIQIAKLIKSVDRKHLVVSGNSDMQPTAWHLRQAMLAHRTAVDPANYPMDSTKDTFDQYREILDFYNPPVFDMISVHYFAPDASNTDAETPGWLFPDPLHAVRLPWARTAAELIGKPLFVGAFGQPLTAATAQSPSWLADMLVRVAADMAPLAAVWTWETTTPDAVAYSLSPTSAEPLVALLATSNQTILNETVDASGVVAPKPK